jgi:hypothetical protein
MAIGAMAVRLRVSTWRFTPAIRVAQAAVWLLAVLPSAPWVARAVVGIYQGVLRIGPRLLRFRFVKADPTPPTVEEALARIEKTDDRIAMTFAAIVFALLVVLFLSGCAARREPDPRPTPPPVLSAHLTAFPPITIARRPVTLRAWVDDPEAVFPCPSWLWTWPNGTHSGRSEDCDPDERATRHYGGTFIVALPSGLHLFRVEFRSQGRELRAETSVEVH